MSGALGVFAGVGDGNVGADGAKQGVHGDARFGVAFENVFEDEAEIALAASVEARGMGVAMDGAFGEAVIELDGGDGFPVEEGLLDFVAVLAATDGAFPLVPVEVGRTTGAEGGLILLRALN